MMSIQILLASLPLLGMSNAAWPTGAAYPGEGQAAGLDCNHNGIEDSIDIAVGRSGDLDQDGVPDECQGIDRTARARLPGASDRPEGDLHPGAGRWDGRPAGPLVRVAPLAAPRPGHFTVRWARPSDADPEAPGPVLDPRGH